MELFAANELKLRARPSFAASPSLALQPVAIREEGLPFVTHPDSRAARGRNGKYHPTVQTMADREYHVAGEYYTKSGYFLTLEDRVIEILLASLPIPSRLSEIELSYTGGAGPGLAPGKPHSERSGCAPSF